VGNFFDVYGPFDIEREAGIVLRSQPTFWENVREADDGLDKAIGCYMFCLRHGESITPWYVGMTIAVGGFFVETFTQHKLKVYNDCLDYKRGRPQMFFFPLMTGNSEDVGSFSQNRSQGAATIGWLEKTLMGMALQRNEDLWNQRDTTLPRSVTVRGIMGEARKGRQYGEVTEARRALFG